MSKELSNIKAKIEIPDLSKRESKYKKTKIKLSSFYGGIKRGKSLQIGFLDEKGESKHIQLDNNNVKELIKILKDSFEE